MKNFTEDWTQNEAFRQMDPKKQSMIRQLAQTLDGKNVTEALPVLTRWRQQIQQEQIVFTAEENQLLTEIFLRQLTPAQRQQFEYLKQFMK